MKYKIVRLDGRHSYNHMFEYSINFPKSMLQDQGPLDYNDAMLWFLTTWGWSAEIAEYVAMETTVQNAHYLYNTFSMMKAISVPSDESTLPVHCNPHWSWSNRYDDLRIYVKSGAELTFFQLRFPVD